MHDRVVDEPRVRDWGDWRLGDLSDAVRRVCDTLGPSAPAATVTVCPPDRPDASPAVTVLAPDTASLRTIRSELVEGGYCTRFLTLDDDDESTFEAEVSGLVLHVWCLTPRESR